MQASWGPLSIACFGATIERPGRLGNDSVNFSSTAFSTTLAIG